MPTKFSQFLIGGLLRTSDTCYVGLRGGQNTQFAPGGMADDAGNPIVTWERQTGAPPPAGAVNYVNFISSFTGNPPIIEAKSLVDTNVNLLLRGQGALGFVEFDSTGAMILPRGTTAQRPAGSAGEFRYDATLGLLEYFDAVAGVWKYVTAGGSGSSTQIEIVVTQPGHVFTADQAVFHNGAIFALALASNAAEAEVIGMVTKVDPATPNEFTLLIGGEFNATTIALIPGGVYYVSDTVPGLITLIEPVTVGFISKPIVIAKSVTSGVFYNFRGKVIPAPAAGGSVTSITAGSNLTGGVITTTGTIALSNTVTGLTSLGVGGLTLTGLNIISTGSITLTPATPAAGINLPGNTFISGGSIFGIYNNVLNTWRVSFSASALTSSHTYILPPALPASDGYLLSSTAAGAWSWVPPPSSSAVTKTITQANAFTPGQLVYITGGGAYALASANNITTSEVVGIVTAATGAQFTLVTDGYVTGVTGTGIGMGAVLYLSDVTPGLMTNVSPTTIGNVQKAVFVADSATSGYFVNYVGRVIPAGTGTTGTGATVLATSPTITTPNIIGVTNASNATPGSVGEVISSTVLTGAATAIASATATNLTSVVLTAGDWDVYGNIFFQPSASVNQAFVWCSLTSATLPNFALAAGGSLTVGGFGLAAPFLRVNVSVTTTVYLSGYVSIPSGTCTQAGVLSARRAR